MPLPMKAVICPRYGPPEVLRRIAAGEDVDPSLYYMRTTPAL